MKKVIKEMFRVDDNGDTYYSREETLISDDEYYARKYCETIPHESLSNIFDAYQDYVDSMYWN